MQKYAYLKDGSTDHEIIAMEHSFHGRTYGALSVTGTPKYREAFQPMIGNIKFATFNDLESVRAQITDKTCAVIMETIQGEGGIYPATKEFLEGVRALCDEHDILLILDEIQCGMGRSGYLFAWQEYGVKPDIMTTAKAIGCGVPVGAFLMTEKVGKASLTAGDHGTTYGGNPLGGTAITEVLRQFEVRDIPGHAKEVGAYLYEKLEEIKNEYDVVMDHRGKGLMQGLELNTEVAPVINAALDAGLVLINAGTKIIRFLPPLVIEKKDVDTMITVLKEAMKSL